MDDDQTIEHAIAILEKRLHKPSAIIKDAQHAATYLSLQLAALEYESFRVLFLNNRHGLITLKELFRGTVDGAAVYPREVVKAALQFNAAAVILTHNHPSGDCHPSAADRAITRRLKSALSLVDIRVLDHIVVGGTRTYSFAEHGLI